MPKYRKLHTKIRDSADVNDMPDDFCRLAWTWLPTVLDSEGRGYDDPQWLRSVLFPKRRDVTVKMLEAVLNWWQEHKMIVRYAVNGQFYFSVPSFKQYQTGTERESKSSIPPPNKRSTRSRPTRDLLATNSESPVSDQTNMQGVTNGNSCSYSYSDSNANSDSNADASNGGVPLETPPQSAPVVVSSTRDIQKAYEDACKFPVNWTAGNGKAAKWLSDNGYSADQVRACYTFLKTQDFWKSKAISVPTLVNQIGEYARANAPPGPPGNAVDWSKFGMTPSGKLVELK